jgi:hypothetical protein
MGMRPNGAVQRGEAKAIMGKKARRSGKPRKGLGPEVLSADPPPVVDPFRESSAPRLASEGATEVDGANENASSETCPETESPPPTKAEAGEADEADEASVPPVSDWDSAFFSDPFADDEPDPRAERHAIFAAAADRRAHLARYVIGAVGFSSALCLAALLKVALVGAGGSASGAVTGGAAATLQSAPTEVSFAAPDESFASASASVSPGSPVEPASSALPPANAPTVEPSAQTQEGAELDRTTAAPSASVSRGAPVDAPIKEHGREREAMRQREASRSALERNGFTAAVEAGERAVALDPTDGESWLILGAAYQARGDAANARRCYRTCLAEAKRGPRSECAGMLR